MTSPNIEIPAVDESEIPFKFHPSYRYPVIGKYLSKSATESEFESIFRVNQLFSNTGSSILTDIGTDCSNLDASLTPAAPGPPCTAAILISFPAWKV